MKEPQLSKSLGLVACHWVSPWQRLCGSESAILLPARYCLPNDCFNSQIHYAVFVPDFRCKAFNRRSYFPGRAGGTAGLGSARVALGHHGPRYCWDVMLPPEMLVPLSDSDVTTDLFCLCGVSRCFPAESRRRRLTSNLPNLQILSYLWHSLEIRWTILEEMFNAHVWRVARSFLFGFSFPWHARGWQGSELSRVKLEGAMWKTSRWKGS